MNLLHVDLAGNGYDIIIGSGILAETGVRCRSLAMGGHAAVITNPAVDSLYGDIVADSLLSAGIRVSRIIIPDGEEYKNSATLNMVYDRLVDEGLDRSSFIAALGGGVVGDLAGYAAATYLRGIPFIQLPTTLLAQVDSSVGGKTAIDHPRGKNLIGAFYQPRLVLADIRTLNTLDSRQFRAGLAEVIKYGVVLDKDFLHYLEENAEDVIALNPEALNHIIAASCAIKARVVAEDEKESGLRAVLNYGHTLGHAIETLSGYGRIIHGEAIAIGMSLAAHVSLALGMSSAVDEERIRRVILQYGLSLDIPEMSPELLKDTILHDKKSRDGAISFVCNRGIGDFELIRLSPSELLKQSGLEV